ncbi:MAG: hypothetical protein EXR94_07445 [Gemmatimonadetes bacterium]|nr:hypothetical protein [Gemmatimonadota bacterium]
MARIFLWLTVGLGVLLIYGRWAERPIPTVTISVAEPKPAAPVPALPPVTALAAGGSVNESRPEHRTPLIAQLARIEVRRRLALAGPTVYLDSLLVGPDSAMGRRYRAQGVDRKAAKRRSGGGGRGRGAPDVGRPVARA